MVSRVYNLSTWKTKARKLISVQYCLRIHGEFLASLGYLVRLYLEKEMERKREMEDEGKNSLENGVFIFQTNKLALGLKELFC